jgi:FMN phosphatase YigB (HAD superfamily)
MPERCKTVFLDWNGTLSRSEFFDHLKDPDHPNSNLHEVLEDTLNLELWPSLAKPWMRGELKTEDIAQAMADRSGVPYDTVFQEIVEGSKSVKIDQEVLEVVSRIRENGVKVLIATGNVDAFDRWTVPALGLEEHFDGIINSYALQVLKKDRDEDGNSLFFREFFEAHDISPEECIIIDDMQDEEGVIESFGMKLVRLAPDMSLSEELNKILRDIEQGT